MRFDAFRNFCALCGEKAWTFPAVYAIIYLYKIIFAKIKNFASCEILFSHPAVAKSSMRSW